MRRKFTVGTIVLSLLVLAACVRGPQHYIESGNRYFKENRYAEAALEYRNAIQKDSSSVEAHYGLGLTQIAQSQLRPAITTLGIVLRLRPDHSDALVKLGDIYLGMFLGDPRRPKEPYDQLRSIATKLLAKDANSYDGLRFQGYLAVLDGKPGEAREFFSRADRIQPDQPQLQIALADAMVRDNLPEDAKKLALAVIEKHKSFGPAYDFLHFLHLRLRRPGDAEQVLVRKAEANPQVADFQLQLAGYYLAAKRPADAEPVLKMLLGDSKTFPDAHLRVGDLYLRFNRTGDAQRHFEEGLRTDSGRATDYKKRLTRLFWASDRKQQAIQLAAEVVKAAPNDAEALELRASLLLEEGKPENLDQVIADYTRLSAANPQNPAVPYQLGRARLRKGQTEQAAVHFAEAIRRDKTYLPPHLSLAGIRASQRRHAETLRHLDDILAIDAANARVRVFRAATLRNLGRYHDARRELTELLRRSSDDVDAHLELGLLNLAEGRLKDAEAIFGKLYRSRGTDLRPTAGLVQVYSAQQQYGKAIELLNEEVKKIPGSVSARQALATVALRAGNVSLALAQLHSIVESNSGNALAHIQIGRLETGRGNVDEGLAAFRKATEVAPKDVNVLLVFAAGLQESARLEEAEAVLQRAIALDAQNPVVLNNLAYLLAESGKDLDKALLMARTASQKEPSNRHFRDTLGAVYLKKKMVDDALQIYRSLASAEPDNATFRMHHGMALLEKGHNSLARNEFQAALRLRNSPSQERKLRQLMEQTGQSPF